MVRVKINTILEFRKIIGQGELEVSIPQGSTMKSLLSWMAEKWGERLSSKLLDPGSGNLLPHVRLMVNGRDIGVFEGLETELQDGDEVLIMPFLAGG